MKKVHFKFKKKDLNKLIKDPNSLVKEQTTIKHIAMHPVYLRDLRSTINDHLDQELGKFDSSLNGILLSYDNIKLLEDIGSLLYEDSYIHLDFQVNCFVFKPELNSILLGKVNKIGKQHLSVLVHKYFNVSILRPFEEDDTWLGNKVQIGNNVQIKIQHLNFSGNIPFIQATILNISNNNQENEASEEANQTILNPDLSKDSSLSVKKQYGLDKLPKIKICQKTPKNDKKEKASTSKKDDINIISQSDDDSKKPPKKKETKKVKKQLFQEKEDVKEAEITSTQNQEDKEDKEDLISFFLKDFNNKFIENLDEKPSTENKKKKRKREDSESKNKTSKKIKSPTKCDPDLSFSLPNMFTSPTILNQKIKKQEMSTDSGSKRHSKKSLETHSKPKVEEGLIVFTPSNNISHSQEESNIKDILNLSPRVILKKLEEIKIKPKKSEIEKNDTPKQKIKKKEGTEENITTFLGEIKKEDDKHNISSKEDSISENAQNLNLSTNSLKKESKKKSTPKDKKSKKNKKKDDCDQLIYNLLKVQKKNIS